jgi:predicted nucleic acid-binding protein
MILLDSNVLIALCEPRDQLHRKAVAHLEVLRRHELATIESVLCETSFGLPHSYQRDRLRDVLSAFGISIMHLEPSQMPSEVLAWLNNYADHEPDWADACIAVHTGADRKLKVWTYDQEFATLWRRPDGSRIPLAARLTP